jgi:hypothetical protein
MIKMNTKTFNKIKCLWTSLTAKEQKAIIDEVIDSIKKELPVDKLIEKGLTKK